jgi:hypothetical protein
VVPADACAGGAAPLQILFERVAVPCAQRGMLGLGECGTRAILAARLAALRHLMCEAAE